MARITIRKCLFTGKLFEDDAKYRKHLEELRETQRFRREKARRRLRFGEFIEDLYRQESIQAIEDWLNANIHHIVDFHSEDLCRIYTKKKTRRKPEDKITIKFSRIRWDMCRTTHSAPRGQKTTGWGDPHIPEDGWRGEIEIYFEGNARNFFETDILRAIGINSGAGGGSNQRLRFDLTLFAKDFPILTKNKYRSDVMKKLSDGNIVLPV